MQYSLVALLALTVSGVAAAPQFGLSPGEIVNTVTKNTAKAAQASSQKGSQGGDSNTGGDDNTKCTLNGSNQKVGQAFCCQQNGNSNTNIDNKPTTSTTTTTNTKSFNSFEEMINDITSVYKISQPQVFPGFPIRRREVANPTNNNDSPTQNGAACNPSNCANTDNNQVQYCIPTTVKPQFNFGPFFVQDAGESATPEAGAAPPPPSDRGLDATRH